jgi:hypothetical protein
MHRIALRNSGRALAAAQRVHFFLFFLSLFLSCSSPKLLFRVLVLLPPLLHALMLPQSLVRHDILIR